MSTKKEVPEAIVTAINVMLAPYGRKFEDIDETIVKRIEEPRFINVKDAASYSGMSRWLVRFGARQGFLRDSENRKQTEKPPADRQEIV